MMKHKTLIVLCAAAVFLMGGCSPTEFIKEISEQISQSTDLTADNPEVRDDSYYSDCRGFQFLNSEEQEVYKLIDASVHRFSPEAFYISDSFTEREINIIFDVYQTDHPVVFWIDDETNFQYGTAGDLLAVEPIFSIEGEELKGAMDRFEETVSEAAADAPADGSDFEKELYVNDWLIANCEYDDEAAQSETKLGNEYNSYGALVDGKAVCEGYAKAFKVLCDRLGVDCVCLSGQCDDDNPIFGGNHIWNCVNLDGDWYHVDVTWNDGGSDDDTLREINEHRYLNLTDSEISADHTVTPLYGSSGDEDITVCYNSFIPECDSDEYRYFNYMYPTLTSLDDDIGELIAGIAGEGGELFICNVDGSLDYDEVYNSVLDSYAYEWLTYSNEQNDYDHQLEESCGVYNYSELGLLVIELEYK